MELEEMQAVWADLSNQLEKQKKLTDKMIIMMTEEKYRNKINKIKYPEIIGAIVCYGMALLVLFNVQKFDNTITLICALVSFGILVVLPVVSLTSIYGISKINIAENKYKDTLIAYSKKKKRFKNLQSISIYMSFILMLVILPVTTRIFKGEDMFAETMNLLPILIFVSIGAVFLFFFARWVAGCTNRTFNSLEELIKELESAK